MKTGKLGTFAAIAGLAIFLGSCSESVNNVEDTFPVSADTKSSETLAAPGDSCTFSGFLTDAETEGLLRMREEEKFAHDVYVLFYNTYNYIVFDNISKSETAHTSAVLYLINGYGLTDPAISGDGNFSTNSEFAGLYNTLTTAGMENLVTALKTGAFIEEYDIADLKALIAETQNADVLRVYKNLLRGSTFHLKAFTNTLARQGIIYIPEILTQEEYNEIINSSDSTDQTSGTPFTPGTGVCDGTGPNS